MNNQKDTKKTELNVYEQNNVSDVKPFNNKYINENTNKKTEKLVTALYMVSDCMENDNALKNQIRLLGVELLSDTYKFSLISPVDKLSHISRTLNHINEILSLIEISYSVGFISEMNTLILKREFNYLISDLKSHQDRDKHYTFKIDEDMFNLPVEENHIAIEGYNQKDNQKDKRTEYNNMSFINKVSPLSNINIKKSPLSPKRLINKAERRDKIISIIKMLSIKLGQKDISIKDISASYKDCSEKTIQRELNYLVANNTLKKTGAKRWSKYGVIDK